MLKEQVTKIDCESNTLFGKLSAKVLVHGELGTKAHGVVVIDT
jgi:hypothetical protein